MALIAASIIGGVLAVISGGVAYEGAQSRNRAVRRSVASAEQAAAVQAKQLRDAAALEREKQRQAADRLRGRIRVLAGEGVGSTDALLGQIDQDEATNFSILGQNEDAQIARVMSGSAADVMALQSRLTNAVVESAIAGMGGFSSGLQIGGAMNDLSKG